MSHTRTGQNAAVSFLSGKDCNERGKAAAPTATHVRPTKPPGNGGYTYGAQAARAPGLISPVPEKMELPKDFMDKIMVMSFALWTAHLDGG